MIPESAGRQMNPQQQEHFDIFVTNAMKIIHTKSVTESILGRLSASNDPIQGLAELTVDIVNRLVDSAAENKLKLSYDVIVHGGNIVLGEIISVAEAAGIEPLTEEQKAKAFQIATALFIDGAVKSGKITPEELTQMGQQAQGTPEGKKVMSELEREPVQEPIQKPNGILASGGR